MERLIFTTTGCWHAAEGFGCASLGLAGKCDNNKAMSVQWPEDLDGIVLSGSYSSVLASLSEINVTADAAIVLFGNAGGENAFLQDFRKFQSCPTVGGGAAIDSSSGRSALLTGNNEVAVFLITDERYTYSTQVKCIHNAILDTCTLSLSDPRTILKINGVDAAQFLAEKKQELGLQPTDFEHLTLSDEMHVNAHLSEDNGVIKSGRDLKETMLLRHVEHDAVYDAMREFYDDPNAIIFGCAGLSGLLDQPLDTDSMGLFLFGEVCTVDGVAEFGNLMLSKLVLTRRT